MTAGLRADTPHDPAEPWRRHASELAAWALARLVNRTDVWGAFIEPHRRLEPDKKSLTAPARDRRGIGVLTHDILVRHFGGRRIGDLVGLHSTGSDQTSRWLGFDIDNHGGDAERAKENAANAGRLVAALRGAGAYPLVERSCDRDGYHIWVLLDEPAPTASVYTFARHVLAELSISDACETFPKQAAIAPGRYGNWLRLPGRHHTRPFWSEIRGDRRWLAGADAVARMLEHPTAPVSILPTATAPVLEDPAERPRVIAPALPGSALERRIAKYIAKLPVGLRKGTGRNNVGYGLACFLSRDLSLPDHETLEWLRVWNHSNADRLTEAKMAELISDAHTYGQHGYGAGLQERSS